MTYYDTSSMTQKQHDAFVAWVVEEGLDPATISAGRKFSVHNGWISGFEFVPPADASNVHRLIWKQEAVTRPFRVPQKNPVPNLGELFD